MLRSLNGRIGRRILRVELGILTEAIDVSVRSGREAEVLEIASEVREAQSDVGRERSKLAPPLARDLVQDRVGLTVALLDHVAVGVADRIVDRKGLLNFA